MAIKCRATMLGVAPLGLQAIAEEGVAARCVDDEARLPGFTAAICERRMHERRLSRRLKLDIANAAAFDCLRARACRAAEQDLIELRTAYLVGKRQRLVPALGEFKGLMTPVPGGDEFGAPFLHADGFDFIGDAEACQDRQVRRQQRLADMKARMVLFLEQHDRVAAFHEKCCSGGARWATTDYEYVGVKQGIWFRKRIAR